MINTGEDVPGIADAEVSDVELTELLAEAGRCRDSSHAGRAHRGLSRYRPGNSR